MIKPGQTHVLNFASIALLFVALGCGGSSSPDNSADADILADGDLPNGDGSAGPLKVGAACTVDTPCPAGGSGTTQCLTDWPGGYCAVVGCAQHGHDCPEDPGLGGTATTGSKCVLAPEASCLALCASNADCRPEYLCASKGDAAGHGSANVCVPR